MGGRSAIFLNDPAVLPSRAAAAGAGPVRLLAGGLVPALLLGLVQTAIAVGALHWLVGISMDDLPLMMGLAALTSMVFVALNHRFGALFGPVGKFIALVLIALQISRCRGHLTMVIPFFVQFMCCTRPTRTGRPLSPRCCRRPISRP